MVKPIRNEPNINAGPTGPAKRKESKTPFAATTDKVQANADKIAFSSRKASMNGHHVTAQNSSGDNLASLVTKGSAKQRADVVTRVATPVFENKPSLANERKIRSAHIANPNQRLNAAANKVLEQNS
jgi:hypothetical protein